MEINRQSLIDAALFYFDKGCNIVPEKLTWNQEKALWDKQPLIEWKSLKDRRQTQEEFDKLPWQQANAYAVLLGQQLSNGTYLAAIDYDVKGKVTEEAKIKGKEILKDFPTTHTEKTISNGIHLIYYSRQQPKIDGTFHDDAGVELLGENKLCLMAPSEGYERINDNPPTEVENLEALFYEILSKHGFKKNEQDENENIEDTSCFSITKIVDLTKLDKIGQDEYQGKHPIHDSTTEKNFTVNTKHNTWYCFRHSSGGGALQFFAIQQGIIKCEQAKRGALRGKKFKETVILAEQQGLIKKGSFAFEKEESQADRLVKLCLQESIELFYDQHQVPYIRIAESLRYCDICDSSETLSGISLFPSQYNSTVSKTGDLENNEIEVKVPENTEIPQYRKRLINIKLRSKHFKDWLAHLMWQTEEKAPGSEALNSAINVLSGKCLAEGKKYHLYNRVAPAPDGVWIDLSDQLWRAIKVTINGWEIVEVPPIIFKRYKHQLPLPEPVKVENAVDAAWKILDYVNIQKTDEKTKLTFLCTCISYFIPIIPHPLLVIYGPQGSAKSWSFKLIKRIIDPSIPELLSVPRDDKELIQQLDHFWLALYDNLTSMPTWVSDLFCRAATGGGFSKRELYSDDDDVVYDFKRCVGLNGINVAARRGDLLDRSILVEVAKINNGNRRTEQDIIDNFNVDKPSILGGFLSVLSNALKLYPETKPSGLFRMADFTRYGCAIARALGRSAEDFISAYEEKVESQNEEVINAEPVAYVMLDFCEKTFNKNDVNGEFVRSSWEGTPADLYQNLTERAQSLGIKTESRNSSWPKAPNAFTRRLNEISSSLLAKGFEVEVKPGTPRKVIITVGKQTQLIVDADGKQKSEAEDKELHFCRLPAGEPHVCSSCKGLEAVFRSGGAFLCRGCFDGAVRRAVADGCVVVEDFDE